MSCSPNGDCGVMTRISSRSVLNLTLAREYFKKLLENANAKVVRFLNGNYRDFLTEFEAIVAAEGV
jgi:hypothetical protein